MARIRIENLEKDYGALTVLHDCSLEIHNNEFIVLVGPSGSGKTTLLRLIAGLEPISRGEFFISMILGSTIWTSVTVTSPWCFKITVYTRICQCSKIWRLDCGVVGWRRVRSMRGPQHGRTNDLQGFLERRPSNCRVGSDNA